MASVYGETSLHLSDGRTLGYAQWGDENGTPLFFFHGAPGSRLLCPDEAITAANGVRLITPDRPGYGLSDPKRGRWLREWPADVAELADHLGIDRFPVVGWSAGGPHALACAVELPERVTQVVTVACAGPTDEVPGVMDNDVSRRMVYDGAIQDRDGTTEAVISFLEPADGNDGERFVASAYEQFPDNVVLTNDAWKRNFRDHVVEGFRHGGEGRAEDAVAGYGPWGFAPKEVETPVVLWHGGRDTVVAKDHLDHLASALPSARVEFREDGDHMLLYPYWGEILAGLRR